ncbi:Uncharacterized protein dnl_02240 [Desulfonema limicola]|uniref:Uncharacterized protein n=1 Tax=Desulfonema limicola TaxID=45656 RepID=A0A975B3D0_9BACT|nr:Uncharacterized protein dnl_02240 [Desulfonema limicola]
MRFILGFKRQHFLYFSPLPQGHGSFRPVFDFSLKHHYFFIKKGGKGFP